MKNVTLILFGMVLLACTNPTKQEPNNLINKDTFISILYDVNVLEGYLTNINVNDSLLKDKSLGQYKFILDKYNIDKTTYEESYAYYSQQVYFKQMIQDVLQKVEKVGEETANIPSQKQLSFNEFKELLVHNGFKEKFKNNETSTIKEKLSEVENYFRNNIDSLQYTPTDSVTFFYSLERYKQSTILFKSLIKNIEEAN